MLNIHTIKLSQNSIRKLAELDRFQGRWEALETHTTALQTLDGMALHGKELKVVFGIFKAYPVDAQMAIRLNNVLTKGQYPDEFRTSPAPVVFQDSLSVFGSLEVPAPEDIPALLDKVMEWLGRTLNKEEIHPILTIGIFAGIFYQLQPFEYANDKTLRQLITLLMFRMGYSYAPYALLDMPLGKDLMRLYEAVLALKSSVDKGRPDWSGWLDYFLGVLVVRKDELSLKLEADRPALNNMPELSRKILALFDTHERLGMKEIERLTRGARATLKLRVAELVEGGYLRRRGQARSTWYGRV